MTKNSELRRQSREQLGGKIFATNWLLMVVAGIIIGVVSAITRNPLFLAGIAGLVLTGAIRYGTARITVNLAKGGEIKIYISNGSSKRIVPSEILGKTKAEAQKILQEKGFYNITFMEKL